MIKKIIYILAFILPSLTLAENITIIVPFSAGGAFDIMARKVDSFLHKLNYETVVVDIPGAGGAVGVTKLLNSPPNTLMLTSPSIYVVIIEKNLALDNFKIVSIMGEVPQILAVRKDRNLTCEKLKNDDKTYFLGSAGKDSQTSVPVYFITEKYKHFVEVPYKGANLALLDVLSGQIDGVFLNGYSNQYKEIEFIANSSQKEFDGIPSLEKCFGIKKSFVGEYLLIASPNSDEKFIKNMNQMMINFADSDEGQTYYKQVGIKNTVSDLASTIKTFKNSYNLWKEILKNRYEK